MITIVSRGSLPRKALELIGFSTKESADTIGRFGSGTAYAIALASRLGMTVTIASIDAQGPYEAKFTVRTVDVGDREVGQIVLTRYHGVVVDGVWDPCHSIRRSFDTEVPLSMTSDLGKLDWTASFQLVREFVCNARDADPDGFEAWVSSTTRDEAQRLMRYWEQALAEAHASITIVRIYGQVGDAEDVGRHVKDWDRNFRFDRHESEVFRTPDGMILYRKPEPSPLTMFVRGVRCPWPCGTPTSLFDYGLPLELNECRTVKHPGMAAAMMTSLWLSAPAEILAEMLARAPNHPGSWEASNINQFVRATVQPNVVNAAWKIAHGDSPAATADEVHADGAVVVEPQMRAWVHAHGVETASDVAIAKRIAVATHVITMEITDVERRALLVLLGKHRVTDLDDFFSRLTDGSPVF